MRAYFFGLPLQADQQNRVLQRHRPAGIGPGTAYGGAKPSQFTGKACGGGDKAEIWISAANQYEHGGRHQAL